MKINKMKKETYTFNFTRFIFNASTRYRTPSIPMLFDCRSSCKSVFWKEKRSNF